MANRLISFIFCLELLVCTCMFANVQSTEFGMNIVYTKNGGGSSTGTLPTVKLSIRERFFQMTQHTFWQLIQNYTGNCSDYQRITLKTRLSFGRSFEHYQLRIELSPGDPSHCITIDCANGSVGDTILQQWRDGSFWCNTNATILCPSTDSSTFFYSKFFNISGEPSPSEPCDLNHSDESKVSDTSICPGNLVPTLTTPVTTSPTPTTCPTDDIWNEAPTCSVVRTLPSSQDCPNHRIATRVCLCDGSWGPVHCTPSLELVKELLNISDAEQSLATLLDISPLSISNNERLEILQTAYTNQRLREITESFVKAALDLIEAIPIGSEPNATFLSVLDSMALDLKKNVTITSTKGTIELKVREVSPGNGRVLGIQADSNYISLPGELFENLNKPEYVASFHFDNISHLLPGRDPISPVISSILSCTDCRTSNLTENVTILFDLPPGMMNSNRTCVFADLSYRQGVGSDFWNERGCISIDLENGSVLCSCNHLTHFAILLSPGTETPPAHQIALTVIGQVFVSISLVFLLATILTFVLQKSLWNMRNYIHCMLCANLMAAQLVFVVGVERTENEAVCSAIAVLLHYLFLVVFMWMLMEGVVLYVKLVKVFITHHKRYIAFFTIVSYGVPLLYMLPMVPIGLLVNTDDNGHHYNYFNVTSGDRIACWLRYDTHFVWAFIAPVIVIIVVNVGFLIMALVIMFRHLKKQERKSDIDKAKHWVKVTISLVVVMGIAWIGNLLFFDVNLIFVAYIMTIFIAGQGIIIFILFVPLSKQVRDAYTKWWRRRQQQSSFLSKMFPATKGTTLPHSVESKQHPRENGNLYESVAMEKKNNVHTLKLTEDEDSVNEDFENVASSCTLSPMHSERSSSNSPADSVAVQINEEHT